MAGHTRQDNGFNDLYGSDIRPGRVNLTNPETLAVEQRPLAAPVIHPGPSFALNFCRQPMVEPLANELISPRDNARDKWHINRVVVVPLASPAILASSFTLGFSPTNKPCTIGVALSELAFARGLREPRKWLSSLPGPHAWPDYPNTCASEPLTLKDDAGRYITRGAFTKQIAIAFGSVI
ncbi:hypothetical protein C8R45DRAFT_1107093 [Mycena sanguinolenta]|nr:hypothetical protein C8R45DRAFT_1107093 [Mycena sanguinolenta]